MSFEGAHFIDSDAAFTTNKNDVPRCSMPILLRSTFVFLAVCVFGGALGVSFFTLLMNLQRRKEGGMLKVSSRRGAK